MTHFDIGFTSYLLVCVIIMKTLDEALETILPEFAPDGISNPLDSPFLKRSAEDTRQIREDCTANKDVKLVLSFMQKAIDHGLFDTQAALLKMLVFGVRVGQEMEKPDPASDQA